MTFIIVNSISKVFSKQLSNLCFNSYSSKPVFFLNSSKLILSTKSNIGLLNIKHLTTKTQGFHENISALQTKKRQPRKKKGDEILKAPGVFSVTAFSTAEEYNLECLKNKLLNDNLYEPKDLVAEGYKTPDIIHAIAKYQVDSEPREMFLFREGSVVCWNFSDLEISNLLQIIKNCEIDSYSEVLVNEESEQMDYEYIDGEKPMINKSVFYLTKTENNKFMEKYTFSNSMALSVKLSIWESSLEKYIDSIEFITEDLKKGHKIQMTREEVLRKHGELLALRHLINLSSDLLDTPDFYWEQEQFEQLYTQTCAYFSISRRTKVMNEKLNHCFELIELLSSHLSDKHHTRLEWMIIILIMMEVVFETIHYIDRVLISINNEPNKDRQEPRIPKFLS